MNGFQKAFLVGAGVIGFGLAQPAIAQTQIPKPDLGDIERNTKDAVFETFNGIRILMSKFDKGETKMFSITTVEKEDTTIVLLSEYKGMKLGFMVFYNLLANGQAVISGEDGEINSYDGVKSLAEAKRLYSMAICQPFILMDDSTIRLIKVDFTQSELRDMLQKFSSEVEKCLPVVQQMLERKVSPQKYVPPKKDGAPLYRSANYRESLRNIQNAMKAKEIRKPGTQKPFRIRDRLMAKA